MIESKSIALPLGYSPIMVGSDGFEPPKHKVTDLQSAAFGHFANYPNYVCNTTNINNYKIILKKIINLFLKF